ncbi:MAG TPA: protein-L-isoaspartate O-methyltransferase [Bryobacteraceae bacterium]|nr:protein-L-isoaspartate O-methyltransferase [Rhizomicrobium sp.]HWB99283.1 protein-L-isoaspartate O-methyltransferase [Bryobacteraceae bacterium]
MSETARFNMVEAQIRTSNVTDPRIHAAMGVVPREKFVPAAARALAYADVPVAVAPGRYLLDPRSFAKLLQLARVTAEDRVLDVACGTGYSSAVLARLAGEVVALEQDADLVRIASELLANAVGKVEVVQGGLIEGVRGQAPFDVIFVNGAIEQAPETLLSQLAEGGRLVAIMREGAQSRAWLFLKENGQIGRRPDFDADVPLLAGFRKAVGFVF